MLNKFAGSSVDNGREAKEKVGRTVGSYFQSMKRKVRTAALGTEKK